MSERVKQWSCFVLFGVLGAAFLFAGARVQAQAPAEHISVTLTDPSRPATVKTGSSGGKIIVKGSDAKEITVDARLRSSEHEGGNSGGSSEANSNSADGLKRIAIPTATGLYAQEENNVVTIGTQMYQQQSVDLTIGVPYKTSLVLQALGEIVVSDVEGNLEITNYNNYGMSYGTSHSPGITLNNVAGSIVASSTSGKIIVTFTHVDPQKAISFSNNYGNIDVTFPPDLKANLILNSGTGSIYSDFDFQISQTAQQVVEDHRKEGSGYIVKVDKKIHGTIGGGGGPEIQFTTLQGNIYIRKGTSSK